MNWHTQELYLWLTNNEEYYEIMQDHCRTASEFKRFAGNQLNLINKHFGNESMYIKPYEINWIEIYLAFCELVGNENPKVDLIMKKRSLEMNKGTVLKMNPEMNVEMNGKMNVEMNHRMTLSAKTIIRLKNKINFTNFTSSLWTGNRKYWIEGAFYHHKDSILKFRINCESKIEAMETLNKIRRA